MACLLTCQTSDPPSLTRPADPKHYFEQYCLDINAFGFADLQCKEKKDTLESWF
jgi:hypothetical protein